MFNQRKSNELLKKHFNLGGLVSPTRKRELEESDDEDDQIGFDPPPELTPDVLSNTPIIRLTTPIRKKSPLPVKQEDLRIPDRDFFQSPEIPTITRSPVRSPVRSPTTPVIDVSDEDEVNERVNELISNPGDINYEKEKKEIKDLCLEAFRVKFNNLKINYPERGIEFPEGKALHKIHKIYHASIKDIYVNMNIGQMQLGYVICLMGFEFIAIKAFGIPMAGFTKMELKRMYKYSHLMIELGGEFYSVGGGGGKGPVSSLEWRIFSSFAWNVIIFLALKFLSKYLGGESMTEMIRSAVDKIMDNPVTVDNIENGTAADMMDNEGDIGGLFDGLIGGGGDITSLLANLGTNYTQKMESGGTGKSTSGGKKKRVIFNE